MDADAIDSNLVRIHPKSNPDLIQNLLQLISFKDATTLSHVNRVHELTQEWLYFLHAQYFVKAETITMITVAALLHDVGKLGVLDEVLQKCELLTGPERTHMEQHAEIGYQLVRDHPGMVEIAEGIRFHHERFDGAGYPLGLKGNQIPLSARIIAIVDAFDAMTSKRPYQVARSAAEALEEIKKETGRQFCPIFAPQFIRFMHARNT